jgi:hypothetical protein
MSDQGFEKQTEQVESLTQNEYDIDFLHRQEERIKEFTQNLADTEKRIEDINPTEISQNDINNLIALNDSRRNINGELENIGRNLDIYCGKFFYYNQLEEAEDKRKETSDRSKALQLEAVNYQKSMEEICNCLRQLLQSLKNEVETLQNAEKQKFSGPANVVKRFLKIGGHVTENYQNLGTIIEQINNQLKTDDFPASLEITDIINSIESTTYAELRQQTGNQEAIDNIFQEILEAQEIYQTTRKKIDHNSSNQSETEKLLEEQTQAVQREAAGYVRQIQEGKERLNEDSLLQNWLDQIERRKQVVQVFSEIGIDQESEKAFLESTVPVENNAVNLGRQRSFPNIRNSVRLLLERRDQETQLETKIKALRETIGSIKKSLFISCNRRMPSAVNTLQVGEFKTIRDFDAETQRKKAKDPKSPGGYLSLRSQTEQELGWQESENIFSLAVDDPSDGTNHNGSAWQYGSVRFVFDQEAFRDNMIFTESDAMNPDGLPYALRNQKAGEDKRRNPSKRQICFEHLPIAKAIFNLSKTTNEFKEDSEDVYYIEAQTNIDPFSVIKAGNAKEVVLDPDMMENERKESISSWIARKAKEAPTEREAQDWRILNMKTSNEKKEVWRRGIINDIRKLCEQHNVQFRILEK